MNNWTLNQLRKVRNQLRDKLSEEIHKRDAIKAEIMFLQNKLDEYEEDSPH